MMVDRRDLEAHEQEPSYRQSVQRFHERRRREELWERLRWHEAMIQAHSRNLEQLVERHREGVEECRRLLEISETNERKSA